MSQRPWRDRHDDHLELLGKTFQDNIEDAIREAVNFQTDMFLGSVADYCRQCDDGNQNNVRNNASEENCVRPNANHAYSSGENVHQLKEELMQVKSELHNAQALISVLKSTLKMSGEITVNCLQKRPL